VAVLTGVRELDIRSLPVPSQVGPDEALIEIEASGMCGTDYQQFIGSSGLSEVYPCIPGHEPIGRVRAIGESAMDVWGVREGDRVAVEPIVPCGRCRRCRSAQYRLCPRRFVYSFGSVDISPGLWGSHAQFMYLRGNTAVHKLPDELPSLRATMFNALACGLEWAYRDARTCIGDDVLVLGPGQRGLASVVALREAGARRIIVTGLPRDRHKLDLALELGATHVVDAQADNVVDVVREITDGRGVDRVVDTTPLAVQPVLDAIEAVADGGRVVLAGVKGNLKPAEGFVPDKVLLKGIELVGAFGASSWSYAEAIRILARDGARFDKLHTHTFGLSGLVDALHLIGGETDEEAIHVVIDPRQETAA